MTFFCQNALAGTYWSAFLYTLNTPAIGILKGLNKRWAVVDLTTAHVEDLMADYRILQIQVTPQDAVEPQYFLLHDLNEEFLGYAGTVQQMLTTYFDEDALPATYDAPLVLAREVARFYDVFAMNYAIKAVDVANAEPPYYTPLADIDHMRIDFKPTPVESAVVIQNNLVNVNGFYHYGENVGGKGIFVRDAFKSLKISGQNQVGLWDFRELGGFTIVPSLPGQVWQEESSGFLVNFEDVDLTDKTVFFVIAGYFFPVDGTVISQIGAQLFMIDFAHENARMPARYFEAANYLDLSAVQEAAGGETPGTIDTDLLLSADAIAAWIGLQQTFAVIVNRKECYMEQRFIKRSTGNPNQYTCYLDRDPVPEAANQINNPRFSLQPPRLPLVLELGRHPPYWVQTDGWIHTLTIYFNRVGQLLNETQQPLEQVVTSGADQPGSPGLVQHAFLLEFGCSVADPT